MRFAIKIYTVLISGFLILTEDIFFRFQMKYDVYSFYLKCKSTTNICYFAIRWNVDVVEETVHQVFELFIYYTIILTQCVNRKYN